MATVRALGGWASIALVGSVALGACDDPTAPGPLTIRIMDAPTSVRQGDLVHLSAVVTDANEVAVDTAVSWSAVPSGGGLVDGGRLVPYDTGSLRIIATAGTASDTAELLVTSRELAGSFTVVGSGSDGPRITSDLWLHGDHALTGTLPASGGSVPGNTLYAWSIAGTDPVLTDSVQLNATRVNDVKIRADGTLAAASQEHGSGAHAFTLLDLSDPAHPTVVGVFGDDPALGAYGVHNLWIEADHVFAAVHTDVGSRLWVVDVSDPPSPERIASVDAGTSSLHDVYVRDGLAFLSHWNSGLVILDVGNGIVGGSPAEPVEVSRLQALGGQTHNAWYWPETGYIFVGEEDFQGPGYMHVVDASDLRNPVEVAEFRVPGDTPHNFWLDEDRGILYMAWYSRGLIAADVTGPLLGRLDRQGRTIASVQYAGQSDGSCFGGSTTCTWAPQLHDGFVFVSDLNTGLWKLAPDF
ncbi:MAG: hypothetical protein R3314_06260 [Longimicrobiales bacterium]|nr:hypothetical protein [Longimicrobiales bacterium]